MECYVVLESVTAKDFVSHFYSCLLLFHVYVVLSPSTRSLKTWTVLEWKYCLSSNY